MPRISVIVPVYNGERYLRECIDSILGQTFDDIELILIDNKSSDYCPQICDEYAKVDNRVKVIHREVHGWICDGRNDGLRAAKGEWITFVDADDWIDPDHYEKIMEDIADRKIDIYCQGGCIFEYPDHCIIRYTGMNEFFYDRKEDILNLGKHIFVPKYKNNATPINMSAPWDKFYRREFIEKNEMTFDVDVFFADDAYFNVMAFDKAVIVAGTKHIGYHYRQLSNSVTHNFRPDWPEKIYGYLEKLKVFLYKEKIFSEYEDVYNFIVFRCFLNMLRGYYLHPQNNMKRHIVKKELRAWKKKEIYEDAINQKNNNCLSRKIKVFKAVLKIDMMVPLEILLWIERIKNV